MPVLIDLMSKYFIPIKKLLKINLSKNIFALFLHSQRKKGTKELVAQLVEQYTFNVWVLGSSPSQFTKNPQHQLRIFYGSYLHHLFKKT